MLKLFLSLSFSFSIKILFKRLFNFVSRGIFIFSLFLLYFLSFCLVELFAVGSFQTIFFRVGKQNNQCCEWHSCHEKAFLQRRFMWPSLERELTVRCKFNQTSVKNSGNHCGNLFSNWIPSAKCVGYQLSCISRCAFWAPAVVISDVPGFTHQQSSSPWFNLF